MAEKREENLTELTDRAKANSFYTQVSWYKTTAKPASYKASHHLSLKNPSMTHQHMYPCLYSPTAKLPS
jgi:hypothetical protein